MLSVSDSSGSNTQVTVLTGPSPDTLPYRLTIRSLGDAELDRAINDSSMLERLRDEAPAGPFGLIARADMDVDRIDQVLRSFGYYDALIDIRLAGLDLNDSALLPTLEQLALGAEDQAPLQAQVPFQAPAQAPSQAPLQTEAPAQGDVQAPVQASGSLAEPAISGDFRLSRGNYALVGQQLRFTRGRIGFDGASVLDPTLDLEARVQAAGAIAILAVKGTARAPEIRLTGAPEMPEDEVLSRLLFGLSRTRLSALPVTRLGLAAASLAGIEGPAIGLLGHARSGLGLDRSGIGQNTDGSWTGRGDALLEGGRYLSEHVYLGARQGTRLGETQGVMRMQLNPRIRLETDIGADGGVRAGAAFELEY